MATPAKKTSTVKKSAAAKAAKPAAAKAPAKKPAAAHKAPAHKPEHKSEHVTAPVKAHKEPEVVPDELASSTLKLAAGRYSFATGRRKTSVANIRLYSGAGKSMVNKTKTLAEYFSENAGYLDTVGLPLRLTGLDKHVYFIATINGGGINSQAGAVSQGIAQAIAKANTDFRKVLKSNGLLTRDSRMKERKKPGLKRARRGPQWAKR